MKTCVFTLAAAAALVLGLQPAAANEFDTKLRVLAVEKIAHWASDPVILDAIRHQNEATAAYSQDQIDAMDKAWRAEVGAGAHPTIDSVLKTAASDYLRAQRDASGGLYTEVFVMDARGLNAAASDVTSDYWQGDEAKWQQTYTIGAGAIHIGEIELDESTQTYQSQVSMAITDPATGTPIGAVTVGVNVEHLN